MNILVVKLSAIGDVIHALPVSYAIKETWPEAHLTWVVEPPARELLLDNPYIDDIIVFEKKKFKSLRGFLQQIGPFKKRLQESSYDAALDLQGLFKSAAIVWLSDAPQRLGTCNMRELSDRVSRSVVGPHAQGHIVERYLDVARALGCKVGKVVFPMVVSARDQSIAEGTLQHGGVSAGAAYAVLAVGANWPNKRWPVESYAALSDWLYGRHIIPVFIGGGLVDEGLAADITKAAEIPPVNLVGRTTLKQLAHILRGSCFTLGGDTGPVHLAAGLGVHTIMLMGPTDANRNGPYGQQQNAMEVDRPCKYCWKRACPKGLDCLAAISPAQVEEKITGLLR